MHVGLVDENDTLPDEAALALALFDHAGTDRATCDDVLEAISVRLAAVARGSTAALDQAAALATALVKEFEVATLTFAPRLRARLLKSIALMLRYWFVMLRTNAPTSYPCGDL
jgi:hypothetical protein